MVETLRPRSSTDIQQNRDVGLHDLTEGIEEPAVWFKASADDPRISGPSSPTTVDLLGVVLLQTEDDLRGHDAFLEAFEAQIRIDRPVKSFQ